MNTASPILEAPMLEALRDFAKSVRAKTAVSVPGQPEAQMRAPFEQFIKDAAKTLDWNVLCIDESRLADKMGCPDFAIQKDGILAGYAELKAPHTGADATRFKGHNRNQFKRFSGIPNILYTDGNDWALYRNGELVRPIVRLSGDVVTEGAAAVSKDDATELQTLLHDFLLWEPILPLDRTGKKINLRSFANLLAPICRMLREDVSDSLNNANSPIERLAQDWRDLLFPDATNDQFADSYAQTVTFALLLGRSEGANPLTLERAQSALKSQHTLLSLALEVLTVPSVQDEMKAPLNLLLRIISIVPTSTFAGADDPWLYFYEDFLAIYDPKLRKDAGAYYTPVEVVHAQIRLVDELLMNQFGKQLGFADSGTITLDPAVGTGTYLLGIIEHALNKVADELGQGTTSTHASKLAKNLYGFERMVGPYAVSELRVSSALKDKGALAKDSAQIYLTDTLESPNAVPPQLPLILDPISKQHEKALEVKSDVPVIVCIGNPPYDRHEAATLDNGHRTGSWVRFGDAGSEEKPILDDFTNPVKDRRGRTALKSLYNLYVYFWRWALWKVFESKHSSEGGIVSFITASSYLDGTAFLGMREHMRRVCDEIWIIDLGGEGRGTRREENIFDIQIPVAIAIAKSMGEGNLNIPAKVKFANITGTRKEKLLQLEAIDSFEKVVWQECPEDWQAPFRPAGTGTYFSWPLLIDLMPWQHSGVQLKRTWPIAPDEETLKTRWESLLSETDRSTAFRESEDRTVSGTYSISLTENSDTTPIAQLPEDASIVDINRYAYRSFDRHFVIADGRLMSRPRPDLWLAHSNQQVYLTSLLSHPLGSGPALTACAEIPDICHFRGSYGSKDIIPYYRSSDLSEINIQTDLLDELSQFYNSNVSANNLIFYIYGIAAHSNFTQRFFAELETKELRIPITKDYSLFKEVEAIGNKLLWLHTYGERFVPEGERFRILPVGKAKCTVGVSSENDKYPTSFNYSKTERTLSVGDGQFSPVEPAVYEFEVSGLKVAQSWLKYRMKNGAGRKSSPLDNIGPEKWDAQMTTDLLHLLWVLEETVKLYPEQEKLLGEILKGECFTIDELPEPLPPDHELRKPPKVPKKNQNGTLDGISDSESS